MNTELRTVTPSLLALVVDDDPAVRRLCTAILHREGWRTCEAQDGETAVQLVTTQAPDVIIMDVQMPGMGGLEATRRLRQEAASSDIPIIMLSAMADRGDIARGLEAGADEYLRKPLRRDEFIMRLRLVGRLRRAWRELRHSNETLNEQTRSLGVLLDLSCVLSRTEHLDHIITHTIHHCALLTFCRRVVILLPDQEHARLKIAGTLGVEGASSDPEEIFGADTLLGAALDAAAPILLNTPHDWQAWAWAADRDRVSPYPAAIVPLRAEGRPVGVLAAFDRPDGRPFTAREIKYLSLLCNQAASSIDNVRSRAARDQAHEFVVIALAKLAEHRDDDTGRHLDRVTTFCTKLAEELRTLPEYAETIDKDFLRNIRLAAPLHDIGKVAIPDAILLKPGQLTDDEMKIMQTHVIAGVETIRSVRAQAPHTGFLTMAEEMIHGHHEWWNGRGYPDGLCGTDIPLSARILAVADVYDALTTKRVYKEAIPHDQAVDIIVRHAGTQFDPQVVAAFVRCASDIRRLAESLGAAAQSKTASPPRVKGAPIASAASAI